MSTLTNVSQSDKTDINGGAGNSEAGAADLDDFDAALEEIAASRGESLTQVTDDQGGDPAGKPSGASDQPGSDGGNAEEAGKNDQAAGNAPPAQTQSSDIWANAPAELREAREREIAEMRHRLSSTQGRLSAADRELARLRKESGSQPAAQGGQSGGQAQAGSLDDDPDIKRFQEEYGEIAGPVMKILKAQADQIAQLAAPVAAVAQDRAIEAQASEFTTFATAHPDWEQYVNDARYPAWLEQQPKAIREAAQRAVNVEDGQEAAWLLSQFKASIGVQASPPQAKPEPAKPSNTQPSADPRRARQLAAGRDMGASAPSVQSGVPDDFDGAIDAIIAQREQQQAKGQFR